MEIKNLENTDFDTIYDSFEKAFSDYQIKFEKDEVQSMLERRGYNPLLSFAAFDHGALVAFTLNGTGMFNGIPTAYDTGTGTIKEYRGQGITKKIFAYSLPFLKDAGVRQYVLEVLKDNHKAISIYRGMNFVTTREFDCFKQTIKHIANLRYNTDCSIMSVGLDCIRKAQDWCDFSPSWQNSMDSIERTRSNMVCLGAFISNEMVGQCVFDLLTGDLTQIAVQHEYRRKGIASRLLHEAAIRMTTDHIKVLNINSDYHPMLAFLKSMNIHLSSRQFEMVLPLQATL